MRCEGIDTKYSVCIFLFLFIQRLDAMDERSERMEASIVGIRGSVSGLADAVNTLIDALKERK